MKTTEPFGEPPPKIQMLDASNSSESDEESSETDDLDDFVEEKLAD